MIVESKNDLTSTPRLCELLQATPRRIEIAAEQAGLVPALRLNGSLYWNAEQVDAIRDALKQIKTQTVGGGMR